MTDPVANLRPHQPLIDSLRGWAAISVLIYHTFGLSYFSAFPGAYWLAALQANRAAVLLFFTISGYVIGSANTGTWSGAAVRRYGWRRFCRIEPIYLVALLLGVIASQSFSLRELWGNGLFLQSLDVDSPGQVLPLNGNSPLWSLHYEVIYYFVFILWWRWPATIPLFLGAGVLVSFGGAALPAIPAFLTSHGTGLVFWLAGLLISRRPTATGSMQSGWIWANICWLHAAQHAATLALILHGLNLTASEHNWLPCGDFILLPGCVTLVAIAGQRQISWMRSWQLLSFVVCAIGCIILLAARKPLNEPRWAAVLAFTLAGLLIGWWQPTGGLTLAARIGTFSYALYAVHMPILILVSSQCAASPLGIVVIGGAVAAWTLTLGIACWLELRWQPWIRSTLESIAKSKSVAMKTPA